MTMRCGKVKLGQLTYFSSRALVIQRAEGDVGQQDGDVEEDGGGGVLQQTAVLPRYTWEYYKRYDDSHQS